MAGSGHWPGCRKRKNPSTSLFTEEESLQEKLYV